MNKQKLAAKIWASANQLRSKIEAIEEICNYTGLEKDSILKLS